MTSTLSISVIIFSILINVYIEMKPENGGRSPKESIYGSPKSNMRQSSIDQFVKQGKKYAVENSYKKAAESYTKAIEKDNSEATFYELRGRCYLKMKSWRDALKDFQKAVLLAEKKSEGTTTLSATELGTLGETIYEHFNDSKEALWCFTQAIKRNPSEAVYYAYRGKCYLQLKDLDAAIADFTKALTLNRGISVVDELELISLANFLIDSGKLDEPMEDILTILGEVELGILADKLMKKKQFKAAIPYLMKAIEISPLDPEYHRNLGTCYLEQQNYDEAVTSFNEVLRVYSNDDEALSGLFKALFHLNKIEETQKIVQTMTETQISKIVKQYKNEPPFDFAILLFTEAIKKSSALYTWMYYKQRSECYLQQGDLKMATVDMQEAVKLHPSEENKLDLIHLLLEDDKKEEAEKEIDSLSTASSTIIARPSTLDFYAESSGCSKGVHYYTVAIEKIPDHRPHYYKKRGDCYITLEKFEEAIADYRTSIELDPNNVPLQIKLCRILYEFKRYNEVKFVLENLEAKKKSLSHSDVVWVEGALERLKEEEGTDG